MNLSVNKVKAYTKFFNVESIWKVPNYFTKTVISGKDLKFLPADKFEYPSLVAPKVKKMNLHNEFMKNNYQNTDDIEKLLAEHPEADRSIGRLPDAWLKLLKKEEIPTKTKEVQEAFSVFAEQTQGASSKATGWEKCNKQFLEKPINELKEKLGKIFGQEPQIKFIQAGSVGKCFRVILNDTETALKAFHPVEALTSRSCKMHGKGVEIAMGVYTTKHGAPKQFPTFYLGKIGRHDDNDAYMLTRFIDKKSVKKYIDEGTIRSEIFCIKSKDTNWNNHIQGTNIEYGNTYFDERFKDWKTRKIAIELADALDANSPERIKKIVVKYTGSKEFESAKNSIEEILRKKQDEFEPSFKKLPLPKEAMEELGVSNKYPLNVLLKKHKVELLMFYKYQWKDINLALKENKITDVLRPEALGSILKESKDKKVLLNAFKEHMNPEMQVEALSEMLSLGISPKELETIGIDKKAIKEAKQEIGIAKYSVIKAAQLLHLKTTAFSHFN